MVFFGHARPAAPDPDPGDAQPDPVPVEPNGHLLAFRREQERRRDEVYRAMRPTAEEVMRRLTHEARRQTDLDRIRREAMDAGDSTDGGDAA